MVIASVASSLPLTFSSEVLRSVSVDSDVLSSVPTAVPMICPMKIWKLVSQRLARELVDADAPR